jgi:hypothetical protein
MNKVATIGFLSSKNCTMRRLLIAALSALMLSACGGGGGGASSSGGVAAGAGSGAGEATPVATGAGSGTGDATPQSSGSSVAALQFSSKTIDATWEAGTSASLPVTAEVVRPGDFNGDKVYAYLVDTTGVILPTVQIQQTSSLQYAFVLQTPPGLAPGTYKNNFTVNLCRDAGCTRHYPGSPMLLPYAFEVKAPPKLPFTATNTAPLFVTAYQNQSAAIDPVKIAVKGAGLAWTVTSNVSWAKFSPGTGRDNATIAVAFDIAGLSAGTYTGALTLTASDGQTVQLPLSLQVLPPAFRADPFLISFTSVNGRSIDPQRFRISYTDDVARSWSAATDLPWLSVTPASGAAPGDMTLSIPQTHGLASGIYTGNLVLSSPSKLTRTVPVQLQLVPPTLSLSSSSLVFGGQLGRQFTSQALTLNLNTLNNAWPWKLSTLPGWLTGLASGTVSQAGTTVTFDPKPDTIPVGTSSVVVNATVTVNGDTIVKPVAMTINKDQRKIVASEAGVAFVSTPQWARLTRTLTVAANFGTLGAWSASSDRSWLTVTGNGDQLVLSADATSLAANSLNVATVTLSSSVAGVAAPEPIRVGLWKGAAAPAAMAKLARSYTRIVADPIRPFVYVHADGSTIDAYNVYTGVKIATSAPLGAALADMAVSPNGDSLYVTDAANRNVIKVGLPNLAKVATWPSATGVDQYTRMLAIRPNGAEVLLLSNGDALATTDGRQLGKHPMRGVMTASSDGKQVYVLNEGISPATLTGFATDYSDMGGGTLLATQAAGAPWDTSGENGRDVAVSRDGQRVYTASGAPYVCLAHQGSDLSPGPAMSGGEPYPDNIEVASDGRVYCGISGWYSPGDIWMYDKDGALLKSFKFAGYARELLPRQMVVSGDGMILVGLTDDPLMAIIPVGP